MIVVIDYGMGNIGSIVNMYKRLGIKATISRDPELIARAERLILPGVGAFDQGMENLENFELRGLLERRVIDEGVPLLGICLGMQLLTRSSEEGVKQGLGWIAADTVHFRKGCEAAAATMKFPHIGWEFVDPAKPHPVLSALPEDPRFYFVHTYKVACDRSEDVLLTSSYHDVGFTAAVARNNVVGVQFHPEKSHKFGMKILTSFANWKSEVPVGSGGGRASG